MSAFKFTPLDKKCEFCSGGVAKFHVRTYDHINKLICSECAKKLTKLEQEYRSEHPEYIYNIPTQELPDYSIKQIMSPMKRV